MRMSLLQTIAKPLLQGAAASFIGVLVAGAFFIGVERVAATGLIAIALTIKMKGYLDQNREAIWSKAISPWRANFILALEISSLFLGIFFVALTL